MSIDIEQVPALINIYSIVFNNSILYFADGTTDRFVGTYNLYAYDIDAGVLYNMFDSGVSAPTFGISSLGITPDGKTLFGCGSADNQVYFANIDGVTGISGVTLKNSNITSNVLSCCQGNIVTLNNTTFLVSNGESGNISVINIDTTFLDFTVRDWTKRYKIGNPVGVTTDDNYIYTLDVYDNSIIRAAIDTTSINAPYNIERFPVYDTLTSASPSDIVFFESQLYVTDMISMFIYDVTPTTITYNSTIFLPTGPFAVTTEKYFSRSFPTPEFFGQIDTYNIVSRLL